MRGGCDDDDAPPAPVGGGVGDAPYSGFIAVRGGGNGGGPSGNEMNVRCCLGGAPGVKPGVAMSSTGVYANGCIGGGALAICVEG